MNVRITQIDGKLPNIALMRLSRFHRDRGDTVGFYRTPYRQDDEPEYGAAYGSAIFDFSAERVARFKVEFPYALVGGTGGDQRLNVDAIVGRTGEGAAELDYGLYADFAPSIGFTQRGCRLSCDFCVVPKKEGKPRPTATIADIWRGQGHPKKIHLLDNDFFGNPLWRERIAEIRDGGFKVCFNQGINIRVLTNEIAAALASIEYRDDQFQRRRLYTAWDSLGDGKAFFRGVDRLEAAGVPGKNLMAYMLVGYAPGETWDDIFARFNAMVARGIRPYPMVYGDRPDLKRFQRWVIRREYLFVPWAEYGQRRRKGEA